MIKKYNTKLDKLKETKNKHIRKKSLRKIEKKKRNKVDRLHWDFINDVLDRNDVLYLGDIKSHDIVKDGRNKYVNRAFNDLKFYLLKQRFIYKALMKGKIVFLVPEPYTTKTCSCCGKINEVGSKKVFECSQCNQVTGRDLNAAKNIKIKGMLL